MEHPTRAYLAELIVKDTDGNALSRGSGYLVAPEWVLTAAHVLRGAATIDVYLGAPSQLRRSNRVGVEEPSGIRKLAQLDLALVPVSPSPARAPGVPPPPFGQLDRESAVEVSAVAEGFPWYKLRPSLERPGVEVREVCTAHARITGGSNLKTGSLAFILTDSPPASHEDPGRSPWEGMSGAAVFVSGHLVGVIGQHHPREGLGTLTVRPLQLPADNDLRIPADALGTWADVLPQLRDALPVMTSRPARALTVRCAQEIAEALAPDLLQHREKELDRLDSFSLGSKETWRWIQGDAFAGKTALLASFVLHPPEGVDVVGCFLAGQQGRNTAHYALEILNAQLAALAGRDDYVPSANRWELPSQFTELLTYAANASRQRDHRLLLVIDGLDEYDTRSDSLDCWLRDSLPDGVSLLASSRARVPVRLRPSHPLYEHIEQLSVSGAATALRVLAETELNQALAGDKAYDIVGYLAAAGGGLTRRDIMELLERHGKPLRMAQISAVLREELARTVLDVPDPSALPDHVLVFAHSTLQDQARDAFSGDLQALREEFDAWAEQYRNDGWPAQTPSFLFQGYRRLLTSQIAPGKTPEPAVVSRIVTLLDDRKYREALRIRRGWLTDYVQDIELLAKVAPEQVREVCYRALATSYPNSYLRQRLLDLLLDSLPSSKASQRRTGRPTLQSVIDVLRHHTVDVQTLRDQYVKFSPTSKSPVVAALILGMGRVGGLEAAQQLLNIFNSSSEQRAWAAADALLATAAPKADIEPAPYAEERRIVRENIIEDLISGYPTSKTDAERRRCLYVLAFLKAEDARELAALALASPDSQTVGWALKLLGSIGASTVDVEDWLDKLRVIAAGKARSPWHDEWTQKRLIRALHVGRLTASQSAVAHECAQRLTERLVSDSSTRNQVTAKRRALLIAVAEFDRWLLLPSATAS